MPTLFTSYRSAKLFPDIYGGKPQVMTKVDSLLILFPRHDAPHDYAARGSRQDEIELFGKEIKVLIR
jgi:hypothetical protein